MAQRLVRQIFRHPLWLAPIVCLLLIFSVGVNPMERWSAFTKPAPILGEQIWVDQLGWRTNAVKVALLSNPQQGQNADITFMPGETFELHEQGSHKKVYQGQLNPWQQGKTDESSGDQVWSADFSDYRTPGRYYLYEPKTKRRSPGFAIAAHPYGAALTAAVKAFYYQRCGTDIPTQYGGNWTHPPCHIQPRQDVAAARYTSGQAPRDVHGGWHDAGDFNKYVPFTAKTLWNLIDAYEHNPKVFSDQSQIPESGNGVPDLLDEIKWELDWMLRMQLEDGSVANRVASDEVGEHFPHQDKDARYYTEPTTWATAAFIVGTANTSRVFAPFESVYPGYHERLLAAAEQAWQYLENTPQILPTDGHDYGDSGPLSPASQASEEERDGILRLWAAAELYRATQNPKYKAALDAQATTLAPDWFDPYQDLAYVTYARTPGASPAIVNQLKVSLAQTLKEIDNLSPDGIDPYRAYIDHYHWGSNQSKSNWGLMFLLADELGLKQRTSEVYRQNAEEYLHYFHGRNPLGWVYLSNMGEKGAKAGVTKTVMELYHGWFHAGSVYDGEDSTYGPAPGFVTGGPNQYYSVKEMSPPYGEPHQKAFLDWNSENKIGANHVSEASWEITEPAIYYQAAYVDLLSYFAQAASE